MPNVLIEGMTMITVHVVYSEEEAYDAKRGGSSEYHLLHGHVSTGENEGGIESYRYVIEDRV